MDRKNKKQQKLKDWLTLFGFLRNFQMSLVDNGNFLWSFQRRRSLFFLKLSATEDSIENVSRNKLRCANFLAGRFTIFFLHFLSLFFPCALARVKSFSALSFSPLLSRENLFLHFLSLFFPCALARVKSFSALSFSPLLSRENLFLHFLSLFFPC